MAVNNWCAHLFPGTAAGKNSTFTAIGSTSPTDMLRRGGLGSLAHTAPIQKTQVWRKKGQKMILMWKPDGLTAEGLASLSDVTKARGVTRDEKIGKWPKRLIPSDISGPAVLAVVEADSPLTRTRSQEDEEKACTIEEAFSIRTRRQKQQKSLLLSSSMAASESCGKTNQRNLVRIIPSKGSYPTRITHIDFTESEDENDNIRLPGNESDKPITTELTNSVQILTTLNRIKEVKPVQPTIQPKRIVVTPDLITKTLPPPGIKPPTCTFNIPPVLCWNANENWKVRDFWAFLRKRWPTPAQAQVDEIDKIARVSNANGNRFDVFVLNTEKRAIIQGIISSIIHSSTELHAARVTAGRWSGERRLKSGYIPPRKHNPSTRPLGGLRILSWNLNGIIRATTELQRLIRENAVDIAILLEPKTLTRPHIEGYRWLFSDSKYVTIVYKANLKIDIVDGKSPWIKVLRCHHQQYQEILNVVACYIPHDRNARAAATQLVAKITQELSDSPLILAGDLNTDLSPTTKRIQNTLLNQALTLNLKWLYPSWNPTFKRPGCMSRLDHIVCTATMWRHHILTRNLGEGFGSDHCPLLASFRTEFKVSRKKRAKVYNGQKVLEATPEQIKGLRALLYAQPRILSSVKDKYRAIKEGITSWAEKWKMTVVCQHSRQLPWINPECNKARKRRRKEWIKLKKDSNGQQWDIYRAAKKVALDVTRTSKAAYNSQLSKQALSNRHSEPRKLREWLKSFGLGRARKSTALGPILSGTELLAAGPKYRREIAKYWQGLGTDDYSESCTTSEFHKGIKREVEEKDFGPVSLGVTHHTELDGDFSLRELKTVVLRLPNNKAPGPDGIPYECIRVLFKAAPEILLELVNATWSLGMDPEMAMGTIVPIFKDGDPHLLDNYRGITLLQSTNKLISALIHVRLMRLLESKNYLLNYQAGFRWKRNCAQQITALTEVLKRRSASNHLTYALFFDLKKAYDRVWLPALWYKVAKAGIGGRTLKFLRTLYGVQTTSVKTTEGETEYFPINIGVRQGDTLSPLLFNIFINDIFDNCVWKGVAVPALHNKLPGLLYADDMVCLAEEGQIQQCLLDMENWAVKWRLNFAPKKCGILPVPRKGLTPDWSQLDSERFLLHGDKVEIVKSYKYLGCMINWNIDWSEELECRRVKTNNAYNMLKVFLRSKAPIWAKLLVIRERLYPIALWGNETIGTGLTHIRKVQTILNCAIRSALHIHNEVPNWTLWTETGLKPLWVRARLQQLKSLHVWQRQNTVIGMLLRQNAKLGVGGSWSKRLIAALKSQKLWYDGDKGLSVKEARPLWRARIFGLESKKRLHDASSSHRVKFYLDNCPAPTKMAQYLHPFLHISAIKNDVYIVPAKVQRALLRVRCDAFPLAPVMVHGGILSTKFHNRCLGCGELRRETLRHIWNECTSIAIIRVTFFETIQRFHLLNGSYVTSLWEKNGENLVDWAFTPDTWFNTISHSQEWVLFLNFVSMFLRLRARHIHRAELSSVMVPTSSSYGGIATDPEGG